MTTHVRIDSDIITLLDYLCGHTGEMRPQTLRRIVVFAVKERQRFMQAKKYNEVISIYGEPTLSKVTK